MEKAKSGTASLSESELRAQAVALRNAGKSCQEVAETLMRSTKWVQKWHQRWKRGYNLQDQPRSGRPKVLSARAKDVLRKAKDKRHQSCRRLTRRLKNLGENVSRNTVHRYLTKNLKLKAYKRTKKPRLTELQKKKRLAFAKKYQNLTKDDWENWIFSDECPIYLFPTGNPQNDRIYSQSRENVEASEQVKFSPYVMVWGAMSASGLTDLHMLPQGTTVNAQYYIGNILENVLLPALRRTKRSGPMTDRKMTRRRSESVFVQDGAPAHTARVTQKWCSENLPAFVKKDEWPPNSPDLSPVENLWAILNQKIFHTPAPTTMAQLKSRILKEWQSIDVTMLRNLVHSMPDRLQTVRTNKGGHCDY